MCNSLALRTGSPQSISYNYSLPQSPAPVQISQFANSNIPEAEPDIEDAQE